MAEVKSSPSAPEQIVDLIRAAHDGKYSISYGDGVDLIENYAAVVAAEAAIKATRDAGDRALAAFDAAMSKPLATPLVFTQPIADKDQAKLELAQLVEGTPDFKPVMVYVTGDDWKLAPAVTGCGARSEANAAFIVTACNSHADLVKALEEAMLHLECARSGFISGCSSDTIWDQKRDEIVKDSRATLSRLAPSEKPESST